MTPDHILALGFIGILCIVAICITYYNVKSERIKAEFEKEMASKGYEKRFQLTQEQSSEAEWVKASEVSSK